MSILILYLNVGLLRITSKYNYYCSDSGGTSRVGLGSATLLTTACDITVQTSWLTLCVCVVDCSRHDSGPCSAVCAVCVFVCVSYCILPCYWAMYDSTLFQLHRQLSFKQQRQSQYQTEPEEGMGQDGGDTVVSMF